MARELPGMDELSPVENVPSQDTAAAPAPAQQQVQQGQDSFFEDDSAPIPQSNGRSVKVRADKNEREFNLDPEDKELLETLRNGVKAKRYQDENKAKGLKVKQLETQLQEQKAHADKARQIQSLIERGYRDQAVKLMLGDDGYKDYLKQAVTETVDYDSGDDLTRAAIEKARLQRDSEFKSRSAEDRIKELESRIEERENAVQREAYQAQGTAALQEHSFGKYLKNQDLADKLNQKLWKLAWSDLEEMAEVKGDSAITPAMVSKAFAENAKIMRAGMTKASTQRANAIVEQKKDNAKKTAASMMSSRSADGFDVSQWNGKDPHELLRLMTRK